MVEFERALPLASRQFALDGTAISPAPAQETISLRCADSEIAKAEKALGVSLPRTPKTSSAKGVRSALWLGPDEWLVVGSAGCGLEADAIKINNDLISCVVISHRNTAVTISGERATLSLNSGCPLDLSIVAFPVGACTRTVLGKAEIVLWRVDESTFHIECWRSFSDYVWKFLVDAARLA